MRHSTSLSILLVFGLILSACGGGGGSDTANVDAGGTSTNTSGSTCASDPSNMSGYYTYGFGDWTMCLVQSGTALSGAGTTSTSCGTGDITVTGTATGPTDGGDRWLYEADLTITMSDGSTATMTGASVKIVHNLMRQIKGTLVFSGGACDGTRDSISLAGNP